MVNPALRITLYFVDHFQTTAINNLIGVTCCVSSSSPFPLNWTVSVITVDIRPVAMLRSACLKYLSRHHISAQRLAPKWVRLAPNRTNPGLFRIRFHYILSRRAKRGAKSYLKNSQICHMWGQSDQLFPCVLLGSLRSTITWSLTTREVWVWCHVLHKVSWRSSRRRCWRTVRVTSSALFSTNTASSTTVVPGGDSGGGGTFLHLCQYSIPIYWRCTSLCIA